MRKKIAAAAATTALALAFAGPASADSTSNGNNPNPNGTCFGNQASDYASQSKSNATGTAVAGQAQAGTRAAAVTGYQADCPRNQ